MGTVLCDAFRFSRKIHKDPVTLPGMDIEKYVYRGSNIRVGMLGKFEAELQITEAELKLKQSTEA